MHNMKLLTKKNYNIIFIAVVIISAMAFFSLTWIKAIWYDEVYTMDMIRYSFKDICLNTAKDVHPPLYYILLKLFMLPFGQSEFAARCFSVLPFMVIIIWGGLQVKKLFSHKTSLLFMLFFTFFPLTMSYAVEIRMYSLASMLVFMNAVFAYRCFEKNGIADRIWLVITGAGAAYTHYYALISVGIIYLILLIAVIAAKKKTVGHWIICSIATAILYIPWLKFFIEQLIYKVENEYWIAPLSLMDIFLYFFIPFLVCLGLYITAHFMHNKKLLILVIALTAVPLGTIAVGILASVLVRPVFIMRYVIHAAPLFCLAPALMLAQAKQKAVLAVCLVISVLVGAADYIATFAGKDINVDGKVNHKLMSRYRDCDCYIVYPDNPKVYMHVKGILLFYGRGLPLYQYTEENRLVLDASDTVNAGVGYEYSDVQELYSKYDKIMLIIRQDSEVPQELSQIFDCELTESAETSFESTVENIYILKK